MKFLAQSLNHPQWKKPCVVVQVTFAPKLLVQLYSCCMRQSRPDCGNFLCSTQSCYMHMYACALCAHCLCIPVLLRLECKLPLHPSRDYLRQSDSGQPGSECPEISALPYLLLNLALESWLSWCVCTCTVHITS